MDFSDQAPSHHWSLLTAEGQKIADVWSKPEGEPLALMLQIPQSSFQSPGLAQRLTIGGPATVQINYCRRSECIKKIAE
jgi:hypothetical protein